MTRGQRSPRTVLINRKPEISKSGSNRARGMSEVKVHVEFSGGAELLVGKVKDHDIILPNKPHPWLLRHLIAWIRDNLLKVKV